MLRENRYRIARYLFILIIPISLTLAITTVFLTILYILGGASLISQSWRSKPDVPDIYPILAVAIAMPIGLFGGYRLWAWLVKKLNVLTEAEFLDFVSQKTRR